MNYNVLRYFSVLAQVEHYTVASARLGISQPSLSSAIHNLENDLGGVKLFEKVGRNIRLTEEGKFYKEKVDAALQELHAASMILRDSRSSAPVVIRMGYVSGTLDGLVAQKIAWYSQQNQRVRFHLTESSAEVLMDMVRQEKLDMAIVDATHRDRSLHFRKLSQREMYAAIPVGHALAQKESVRPEEIFHEPQIVFNYNVGNSFQEWTTGTPSDENVICTVDTAQSALDLVAAGMGVSFLPDTCIRETPGVRFLPIKNWHQALYMCIYYDKWLEPLVWDFVELLVNSIRESTVNSPSG
jgi:DNA-binding transcriptional LysR family regulator